MRLAFQADLLRLCLSPRVGEFHYLRTQSRGYARQATQDLFRILAPTAILGYGFPKESFQAALAKTKFDLIAVDAGSIDPGPYYLASRSSFTSLEHVVRDLRIIVKGLSQHSADGQQCKLVVGSAGGCGTDNQLFILTDALQQLLREEGMSPKPFATITSEVSDIGSLLHGRSLTSLGPMPPISQEDVRESVVVAQMGLEPIMCALAHTDIVICGRAYDPALFAAEPVRRGFPAATALHAAKVLECGAIATTPGSGSDCLAAELDRNGAARFWAPNPRRRATPMSVAAHTLYEKSHPHCFGMPGGVLNTRQSKFTAISPDIVEISGTQLMRVPPAVKLEAAKLQGTRSVRIELVHEYMETRGGFVYGINGVEERPLEEGEQELGIIIIVSGGTMERNRSHLALLRASLLHWGFEGRKATAGNLAFPFSPSDLPFDGGMLTVCGTRDPFFIAQWPAIQQDVRAYVSSLSSCDGLSIRFISAGLPGLPRIHVTETDDVHQVSDECWRCDTMAAEYTLQHLVDLDEELMRSMFSIKLWHADGVDTLQAELVPWGDNRIMSTELAYSDWTNSLKPVGSRVFGQTLGDLARVVRSKNAGVNEITFDLIFDTDEGYLLAKMSANLDAARIETALGLMVLGVYCDDASLALKITCKRPTLAGSPYDRDVYGAQQHSKLLALTI